MHQHIPISGWLLVAFSAAMAWAAPLKSDTQAPARSTDEPAKSLTLENAPCSVAYTPFRWLAALCMFKLQADDVKSEKVQQCIDEEWRLGPKFSSVCEANHFWKTRWCTINFHLGFEPDVTACISDATKMDLSAEFGFD
jgi:hypothetical protein